MAQIGDTGRASLAEMRQVLGSLRDDETHEQATRSPLPGLVQLPALVARVEAAGLPVRLEVHGDVDALPAGLGLAAYRVVQEALTNCLKHSHASHAEVTVDHRDAELVVRGRRRRDRLRTSRATRGVRRPRPAGDARAGGGVRR